MFFIKSNLKTFNQHPKQQISLVMSPDKQNEIKVGTIKVIVFHILIS